MPSDPFSTTYEGTLKAREAGADAAQAGVGNIAGQILKQNQRKQGLQMLKQFGLVKQDQPTNDDLTKGLQDYGKQAGIDVVVNKGADEQTTQKHLVGIYKTLGLPLPKGKITVSPGTSMDLGGGMSFTAQKPEKSPQQMAMEMYQTDQALQKFGMGNKTVGESGGKITVKDKSASGDTDVAKEIAKAYENGDQLANFKALYSKGPAVRAELEKRGVNVKELELRSAAETKLAQTLQGPQQVRLRQSINSVQSGLDELDRLNTEFKRTGIKAFNKAEIEAYANGQGTKEQQSIAQQFVTQMIGLQDEFGNVIMSGNSPTDKALQLSSKIFSSDYNDTSVAATISQARKLLNMRSTAIDSVGIGGGYGQEENNATQMMAATPGMGRGKTSSDDDYNSYLKSIGQ